MHLALARSVELEQHEPLPGAEHQLATAHRWEDPRTLLITLREGVRFHDGETMDAEAVRYSLNRHLTMQGSFRRSEINSMESVEVVDPRTVRIRLKEPSAAFLSQLTDRAGMIVSPKAAEAAGRNFGTRPICAGPFRFVEPGMRLHRHTECAGQWHLVTGDDLDLENPAGRRFSGHFRPDRADRRKYLEQAVERGRRRFRQSQQAHPERAHTSRLAATRWCPSAM